MKKTIDWYIKWFGTFFIVLAVVFRSTGNFDYQVYDIVFSLIGNVSWLIVGIMWRDTALLVLNALLSVLLCYGVYQYFM